MITLNVKAENLASVLLIEESLSDFQDTWRHRQNLVLSVSFQEYLKFLKCDTDICKYFNLYSYQNIKAFESNNVLSRIYPLFVQDVLLAQIDEIFRAESLNLPATTITYSISKPYIKRIRSNELEPDLRRKGMYEVQRRLLSKGKGFLQSVSTTNNRRLQYCYLCYGYSMLLQSKPTPFAWVVTQ